MKFYIEVGEIKKHQIEYDFNQPLGRLIIRLDQKEVIRNTSRNSFGNHSWFRWRRPGDWRCALKKSVGSSANWKSCQSDCPLPRPPREGRVPPR